MRTASMHERRVALACALRAGQHCEGIMHACCCLRLAGGRYLLRVSVVGKGMTPDSKRDFPIWVRNYEKLHQAADPIKVRAVARMQQQRLGPGVHRGAAGIYRQ